MSRFRMALHVLSSERGATIVEFALVLLPLVLLLMGALEIG